VAGVAYASSFIASATGSGGTTTSLYGGAFQVAVTTGATATTAITLNLSEKTRTGTIGTGWALYSADTDASYFAGSVLVKRSSLNAAEALSVEGDVYVNGNIVFPYNTRGLKSYIGGSAYNLITRTGTGIDIGANTASQGDIRIITDSGVTALWDPSGDTYFYYDVGLGNNRAIQWKDTLGTYRNVLIVDAADDVTLGNSALDNIFFSNAAGVNVMTLNEYGFLTVQGAITAVGLFDNGTDGGIGVGTGLVNGRLYVEGSASASLTMMDTGATANQRTYYIKIADGTVKHQLLTDTGSTALTFFSAATGTGAITFDNDLNVDGLITISGGMALESNIDLGSAPGTDHTSKGVKQTGTAGEALVFGDLCYLKSDGKYWKADASAATTAANKLVFALATISADATGEFLVSGFIKDATFGTLTIGAQVYLSETTGTITQTAPTTTGAIIRSIGYAESADVIDFQPSSTYLEAA